MKRALTVLVYLAAVAHADPFKPPASWPRDDVASDKLTAQHGQIDVGGVRVTSRLDSFVAPSKHATLWLTRTVAVAPLDQQRVIARVFAEGELGTPLTVVQRTDKLVDITGPNSGDPELAKRLTLVSDGERMIGLMVECITAPEVTAAERAECKAALASTDPELALDKRVAFSLSAAAVAPTPPRTATGTTTEQPTMQLPSAQLGDGDNVKLAPIVIAEPPREKDRRPVYVGIGLVVLAAMFWWNRKRRETFDRSDAPPPRKRTDDDADDLHAAARGEDKDDKV